MSPSDDPAGSLAPCTPGVRPDAPAVSVIIPTYNRADLLTSTLRSVAEQTFTDYEIIVVDDGSNDGTREYISTCSLPIQYHWQQNQGVSEARNHALRVTHSPFVAFLDSDDLWKPRFLERTVGRLHECPDEALVYSDFVSTDAVGRVLRGHRKTPACGWVTNRLFASTFIHTSAVVARADIIRDAGGFDGRLTHNEDYDLWLRLSVRHRFGLIPEPLCMRRCHRDSLSRNGCPPEILLRKAELLDRFHHQHGRGLIDPSLARTRLARLYYTAGKAFLRAGRPAEAVRILRHSLQLKPIAGKTWFWLVRAETRRSLGAPLIEPPVADGPRDRRTAPQPRQESTI
jgi:glycosyltransferase involved in cell wall biosynthesis